MTLPLWSVIVPLICATNYVRNQCFSRSDGRSSGSLARSAAPYPQSARTEPVGELQKHYRTQYDPNLLNTAAQQFPQFFLSAVVTSMRNAARAIPQVWSTTFASKSVFIENVQAVTISREDCGKPVCHYLEEKCRALAHALSNRTRRAGSRILPRRLVEEETYIQRRWPGEDCPRRGSRNLERKRLRPQLPAASAAALLCQPAGASLQYVVYSGVISFAVT